MTATALRGATNRTRPDNARGQDHPTPTSHTGTTGVPWDDWTDYAMGLGFRRRRASQLVRLFMESAQTDYDFGAFRRWLDPTGETATNRILRERLARNGDAR